MEKFWQACQQTGKEEKKEIVYNYLTGPEFRNRVQAIAETFVNWILKEGPWKISGPEEKNK